MKTIPSWVIVALVIVIVTLVIFFGSQSSRNDALAHANDCAAKLSVFQANVTSQAKTIGALPAHSYYDFFVGYSSKLNTCIGGYTDSSPDTLHGRTQQTQDFVIENVLTNSIIQTFTIDGELTKHQELKWPGNDSDLDAANQYAWSDYKTALNDLTGGQIGKSY